MIQVIWTYHVALFIPQRRSRLPLPLPLAGMWATELRAFSEPEEILNHFQWQKGIIPVTLQLHDSCPTSWTAFNNTIHLSLKSDLQMQLQLTPDGTSTFIFCCLQLLPLKPISSVINPIINNQSSTIKNYLGSNVVIIRSPNGLEQTLRTNCTDWTNPVWILWVMVNAAWPFSCVSRAQSTSILSYLQAPHIIQNIRQRRDHSKNCSFYDRS